MNADAATLATVRFPAASGKRSVGEILDGLTLAAPLSVGDERMVDYLTAVSRRLLDPALARVQPELASLGFFLRRAELVRTVERIRAEADGAIVVPRGLVVHFPPANVDTIFVYSWALSALAGNSNVVRISTRSGVAADTIVRVLEESLAEADPIIGAGQVMISYDRDDEVTAALSAACDLRVLWGGDTSVLALRRFPMSPLARELAFPDRSSFAVLDVGGWDAATPEARSAAVAGFVDDVFWFDQAACTSPRDLIWVGDSVRAATAYAEFTELAMVALRDKGWSVDPAMAVHKRVATYALAASGAASRVTFHGNELADVELAGLDSFQREWLGAGVICHVHVDTLDEVVPWLVRKDQTMSYFGFPADVLRSFAASAGGRGIDRIVPFGQALRFASTWDGMDLAREFTRLVTIQA